MALRTLALAVALCVVIVAAAPCIHNATDQPSLQTWDAVQTTLSTCTNTGHQDFLISGGIYMSYSQWSGFTFPATTGTSWRIAPLDPEGPHVMFQGTALGRCFDVPNTMTLMLEGVDINYAGYSFGDYDGGSVRVNSGGRLYVLRGNWNSGYTQTGGAFVTVNSGGWAMLNQTIFMNGRASTYTNLNCTEDETVPTDSASRHLKGGAIYVDHGTVFVDNCVFSSNSAYDSNTQFVMSMTGSTFVPYWGCSHGFGGDIYATQANLHISNETSFQYGFVFGDGGSLYIDGGTTTISNTKLGASKARKGLLIYYDGRTGTGSTLTMKDLTVQSSGMDNYAMDLFHFIQGTTNLDTFTFYTTSVPIFHFVGYGAGSHTVARGTVSSAQAGGVQVSVPSTGTTFIADFLPCVVFCTTFNGTASNFVTTILVDTVQAYGVLYLGTGLSVGCMGAFTADSSKGRYISLRITGSYFGSGRASLDLTSTDLASGAFYFSGSNTDVSFYSLQQTIIDSCQGRTGALTVVNGAQLKIAQSTMQSNAALSGGSIYLDGGIIVVDTATESSIINSYGTSGAALYFRSGSITGSFTLSGNRDGSGTVASIGATCATATDCCSETLKPNTNAVGTGACLGVAGSTCTNYTCGPGYTTITNNGHASCSMGLAGASSTWSYQSACNPVQCVAPNDVPNSATVKYTVASDFFSFFTADPSTQTKYLSGSTTTKPPAYYTGYVIDYTCDLAHGFSPKAGTRMVCRGPDWYTNDVAFTATSSAFFTVGQQVVCDAGLCINITAPDNGYASPNTSVPFYGYVNYTCDPGLMIVGDRSRYCNTSTELEGETPTCQTQKCDTLTNNVDNTCGDQDISIGTTCTIQCKGGYSGAFGGPLTCTQGPAGYRAEFNPVAPTCTKCKAGTFSIQGYLQCQDCPFGTTDYEGAASQAECQCTSGYYEKTPGKGDCTACPDGATCPGRKEAPYANAGYFESGGAFIACSPPDACAGNGTCEQGYTGYLCGACAPKYYRLNGLCLVCPDEGPWKLIVGGLAGGAVSLGLVKMAEPAAGAAPSVNFAAPTIGFSFAQVTASFIDINFKWPDSLRRMCDWFSSLNLNIELANPECTITLTFWDKLKAQIVLPLVIFLFFFVVCVGLVIRAFIKDRKVAGLFRRHAGLTISHFVSGFLLFMTLAYLFLAKATVQFFSCVARADGSYTLAKAPDLFCYREDWDKLLPLAVFALLFYVIGVPLSMCIIYITLRRKRGLTAANTHPLTSFFVAKYESKFWMWECFVMLRKFAVVLFSAIFVTEPNVEALASIAVLFIAAMFTIGLRPYKWNKHDFVEITSLVSSLIVLFAGLITTSDSAGPNVKLVIGIVAVVFSGASIAAAVLCFASEIYVKIYLLRKVRQMGDPTRRVMVGHTQAVTSVLLANDRTLVSGSEDGTMKIWNAMTGECTQTIVHGSGVRGLALLRTNFVMAATYDGTITLWNAHTGKKVKTIAKDLGQLRCIAIDREAHYMAAGTEGGKLYIWKSEARTTALQARDYNDDMSGSELIQPPDNKLAAQLKGVKGLFGKLTLHGNEDASDKSVSADASSNNSSSSNDDLYFSLVQQIEKAHEGDIRCVAIDGGYVYSGGNDHFTRRWSPMRETRIAAYKVHSDAVTAIMISNGVLYTGSADATIRAMIIKTGVVIPSDTAHSGAISGLCFEPSSGSIISSSWDNTIRVWSTTPRENSKGETFHTLPGHAMAINSIAVRLYDNLKPTVKVVPTEKELRKAALAKDKRRIARKKKGLPESGSSSESGSGSGEKAKKKGKGEDLSHMEDEPKIIGLIFSASDDMTIRVFELNMARHLDIKDPLDVLGAKLVACMPTFTEPEAEINKDDGYSSDSQRSGGGENHALVMKEYGNVRKRGGPTGNAGFSIQLAMHANDYSTSDDRSGMSGKPSKSKSGSQSGSKSSNVGSLSS